MAQNQKIVYNCPVFLAYQIPDGYLPPKTEAHALFYYYLLARKNWEEQQDVVVYEGDPDPAYNYDNLFKSVAQIYGVDVNELGNFWGPVISQSRKLGLPDLPEHLRFEGKIKVIN